MLRFTFLLHGKETPSPEENGGSKNVLSAFGPAGGGSVLYGRHRRKVAKGGKRKKERIQPLSRHPHYTTAARVEMNSRKKMASNPNGNFFAAALALPRSPGSAREKRAERNGKNDKTDNEENNPGRAKTAVTQRGLYDGGYGGAR